MAEEFFCTLNDAHVQRLDLYASQVGPWYADVVIDDGDKTFEGRVTLKVGTLTLSGTVVPSQTGTFVIQRSLRVVAGAGNWGKLLPPESYFVDGGVERSIVMNDLLRETGEVLAAADYPSDSLDNHFVRRAGPASSALERLISPSKTWWVDAEGLTHVGIRPFDVPTDGSYQVLQYSPLNQTAVLGLDDPASIWIGSLLSDRFETPQTVRELELHVDKSACRMTCYFGGTDTSGGRIAKAFEALLAQREAKKLYGTYRYRVYSDPGDGTLNLQVVRPDSGLPDVLPVSMFSGVATGLSKLLPGDVVKVAFDEGDPTMPYVAHYPAGDPAKVAGMARMSDLTSSGGPLTTMTLSLGPEDGGYTVPVLAAGVPVVSPGVKYLVSFGVATDPTSGGVPTAIPPSADPLIGYILTASDRGAIE